MEALSLRWHKILDKMCIRDRSNTTGTEIYWDKATNSFRERKTPATTYSLKQVYGIPDAMVSKIANKQATAAIANGTLTITGDVTDYEIDFSTKDGTFTGVGARTSNNKTCLLYTSTQIFQACHDAPDGS